MNRHVLTVAGLWIVIFLIGYALVLNFTPFPTAASEEARVVDDAFTLLTLMAIPVFAFVVAVLAYSVLRFSTRGDPTEDGPPIRTSGRVLVVWFVITTARPSP